jgi:hypothetical protein
LLLGGAQRLRGSDLGGLFHRLLQQWENVRETRVKFASLLDLSKNTMKNSALVPCAAVI